MFRHRLSRTGGFARTADWLRSDQKGHPGARACCRVAGYRTGRGNAYLEAGWHGESPARHYRYAPGTRGLHQVKVIIMHSTDNLLHRLKELNEIGIALSQQRDINSLLETILVAAKRITNADAGTLYLHEPERRVLRFEIMRTDSLNIAMGGTSGVPITFYPIHLYDKEGQPIHSMVVTHSALSGETVNIPDAYTAEGYDFSGTKKFDVKTGYR